VSATPAVLWPPNHRLVGVTLGGASDPDGDPVALTVTGVTQDEPEGGTGRGDRAPDVLAGPASHQVRLRAERSGRGEGRRYRISFTGSGGQGGECSGAVTVGVPHSRPGS
jgi:hypothetical protein